MKKIRHSKLPIPLESSDPLTHDMLYTIQLNMMYDEQDKREENQSGWLVGVDEYGDWFNPFKPKPIGIIQRNHLTLIKIIRKF